VRTVKRLSWFLVLLASSLSAQELRLPVKSGSVRFAIIGDTGTASREQNEVGQQMAAFRTRFPFDFVIMVGDNLYGGNAAADYLSKFELPYKALLDGGVKFYASLGNHDNPTESSYKNFNMGGVRFYTFKPKAGVRFFALDSNYMDKPQLEWLEKELANSQSDWKIAFFHHPLYSSGKTHGSSLDLRALLEPLFIKYGVNVVFSGHDHFYERIKPQKGIYYFVSGAGGSLRKGNINRGTGLSDVAFDTDFQFMLAEIAGADLYFQTISRAGQTVDAGVIHHPKYQEVAVPASPLPPSPGPPVPTVPVGPAPVASPSPSAPPAVAAPAAPAPSPTPTPKPKPKATPKPKKKPAAPRKKANLDAARSPAV
jgi:calcineurin-like phosphoesterase family protein